MNTITLKYIFHKDKECIGIYFAKVDKWNDAMFSAGASWSNTHRCFLLPCNRKSMEKIKSVFGANAEFDATQLKQMLEERKSQKFPVPVEISSYDKIKKANHPVANALSEENKKAFIAFRNMLLLKGYSPNTIRNYCYEFHYLLRLLGQRSINQLEKKHIMSYLLWLIKVQGRSETHVHLAVNAIKFYFEKVLGRTEEFYDLPRPKKPFNLPDILAEEEIIVLLKRIKNLKHRCMIMTGYSAGLRVSEIVSLLVTDIDSKRMMIHVRRGKGKKDRMVPLSKTLLKTLREYYKEYRPARFLFEGQSGDAYSIRSAQQVLQDAKARAGIKKKGSIHGLRHSYATHLLEAGTDIRLIQELLGHNTIRTTMRYTHVSKKDIGKIESPLDRLDL